MSASLHVTIRYYELDTLYDVISTAGGMAFIDQQQALLSEVRSEPGAYDVYSIS